MEAATLAVRLTVAPKGTGVVGATVKVVVVASCTVKFNTAETLWV
jgi:hypothetical protein